MKPVCIGLLLLVFLVHPGVESRLRADDNFQAHFLYTGANPDHVENDWSNNARRALPFLPFRASASIEWSDDTDLLRPRLTSPTPSQRIAAPVVRRRRTAPETSQVKS